MGFELGFEKKTTFLGNGIRTPPSRPSFKDAIAYVERNVFFEMLYTACVQVNSGEIFMHQIGLVREPVWAWMRQCCPSFTDMSANAVV